MRVVNHLLHGVEYDDAQRINGVIVPKFIVNHYTAGYTLKSARDVFNNTIIAAHLIIDVDGTILQMVPFNRGCNHAGPSQFKGIKYLNGHSIGIEYVNIGFLKFSNGSYRDDYGNVWRGNPADLLAAKHSRVGSGTYYWPKYPEAQLNAGEAVTKAILEAYPTITDIVTHEEIDTRGWKTDPGPAFPQDRFKRLIGQRTPPKASSDIWLEVTVPSLNVRQGPGTSFPMATNWPLHKTQRVKLLSTHGTWMKILINDAVEGYIHGGYVKRV